MRAREINTVIHSTMWSVFKRTGPLDDPPVETAQAALRAVDRATSGDDLVIRGWYDVAGLRADADLMVWWHAPSSDTLQDAYHALR
ncbi:MAG TPA: chlorite dismutase family protein, partial [Actinomycetota bacterium]|nr:chlorite dismutase family protein [Actinomycetota bacterium]